MHKIIITQLEIELNQWTLYIMATNSLTTKQLSIPNPNTDRQREIQRERPQVLPQTQSQPELLNLSWKKKRRQLAINTPKCQLKDVDNSQIIARVQILKSLKLKRRLPLQIINSIIEVRDAMGRRERERCSMARVELNCHCRNSVKKMDAQCCASNFTSTFW